MKHVEVNNLCIENIFRLQTITFSSTGSKTTTVKHYSQTSTTVPAPFVMHAYTGAS
jgi:hypothetical protein